MWSTGCGKIESRQHLYPLYLLLFSMPGIPAVYYGSEFGLQGVKGAHSDAPLRLNLDLGILKDQAPHPDLAAFLRQLGEIRQQLPSLRHGDFTLLHVKHQQLAFRCQTVEETVLVLLNSAANPATIELDWSEPGADCKDLLEPGATFEVGNGKLQMTLPPSWGRIITCGR